MTPSITQDNINTALGNLLKAVLPSAVTVIVGQTNRVASPEGDYVVMWSLRRPKLATVFETTSDTEFEASIAGNQMTVLGLESGLIKPGNTVFGTNVADGTIVQSQSSGSTGGAGVYTVSGSQTVFLETMSAGTMTIAQSTEVVMQVDVHGTNSDDNAQVISTIIRTAFAVDQMAASGVTPLYADEPRQVPFITAAQQYEDRWMVEIHMQVTPSVVTPQEFYDVVELNLVDVDVVFPVPPEGTLTTDLSDPDNNVLIPVLLTGI